MCVSPFWPERCRLADKGLRGIAMTIKLNHTIVHAHDKRASAEFFSQVFGLAAPVAFGPFLDVETANEVTLAFLETDEEIQTQHYAFLVSESEFDAIFAR